MCYFSKIYQEVRGKRHFQKKSQYGMHAGYLQTEFLSFNFNRATFKCRKKLDDGERRTNNWLPDSWIHKLHWVSGCLCKIFLPNSTLWQNSVIIQIGLSSEFSTSVAGCNIIVDRTMKMSLFSMCTMAIGYYEFKIIVAGYT